MNLEIKQKLINWAKAKQLASENPKLLTQELANPEQYKINSDLCSQRMKDLYIKLAELDSLLLDNPEAPKEYTRFRDASIDSGCAKCWLSSGIKKHKECELKIKEYFDSEEYLFNFALSLEYIE